MITLTSVFIRGIKAQAPTTRENVFNMLTKTYTWDLFSNHGKRDDAHANSLEAVHDTIHNLVGKDPTLDPPIPGHMALIPYTGVFLPKEATLTKYHACFHSIAFDPIFWMHHSNVDRLFALWQAMNYDVWVTPGMNTRPKMGFIAAQVLTRDTRTFDGV